MPVRELGPEHVFQLMRRRRRTRDLDRVPGREAEQDGPGQPRALAHAVTGLHAEPVVAPQRPQALQLPVGNLGLLLERLARKVLGLVPPPRQMLGQRARVRAGLSDGGHGLATTLSRLPLTLRAVTLGLDWTVLLRTRHQSAIFSRAARSNALSAVARMTRRSASSSRS